MSAYFDDKGVLTSGLDAVRQQMIDKANVLLSPYLDGKPLLTDESSVLGRIFTICSDPATKNEDVLPLIVSSLDPNQAEDLALDNLAYISRVYRNSPSQSEGMVVVKGKIGTVISRNSQITSARNGDKFSINSNIEFKSSNCTGVVLTVTSVGGTYKLNYSIDGYLSQSPTVIVTLTPSDNTESLVADRITDAVNNQSTYLVASKNNDNTITVKLKDQYKVASFSTEGGLSINISYMQAEITSITYTSSEADPNTITKISTPVSGWLEVTNPFIVYASTAVESNESLRERLAIVRGSGGYGSYSTLEYAVRSVKGVNFCDIQPEWVDGLYQGVRITVSGGSEDDVALAIFKTMSISPTFGNIERQLFDINGGSHIIRFNRPEQVPLKIQMSLVVSPNFPSAGNQRIKQAIVEWFNNLKVGDDVLYSRLYEPINSINGFSVKSLKVGKLGSDNIGNNDIIISGSQIATINADDILIGGS